MRKATSRNPHQIRRIKKAITEQDPEPWFFIEFIYYCFIRPKELRHLRVGDVLTDDKRILLRPEVSKNGKHQYVTIPAPFQESVRRLEERDAREWIFPGKRDRSKPASYNYFSRRHRNFMKELGFGLEYKLYSWKHTGAVMAIKAGISVKELQIQLRHHSLDMVNRYLRQMGVEDMENLRNRFPGI